MLFCGILYAAKLICLRLGNSKNNNKDNDATIMAETGNLTNEMTENNISLRVTGTLAIKQLQQNNSNHTQDQSRPHSTSVVGSKTNTNSIKSQSDCPQTFESNFDNDQDKAGDEESNHFYSEISDIGKHSVSGSKSIYKTPNPRVYKDDREDS